MDYLMNGLECSFPHDKIYASFSMLDWDEHFPRPQVDYGKSSIKLAEEVLPHLSTMGIEFPANVRDLLKLVSMDVQQDDVELQALWVRRNAISARKPQSTSKDPVPVRCSCETPTPSPTAIWRCSLWHDERFSATKLVQGSNNSLVVPTKPAKSVKKRKIPRERPEHSLTILGNDVEKRTQEVVGFADRRARAGDVLVRAPGRMSGWEHLLLRRAYGDLYEIIGYAVIDADVELGGEERADEEAHSSEQRAQSEPPDPAHTTADPFCFDSRLDAEDVRAYTFPSGNRHRIHGIEDAVKLINCSFKRSRFSSFATACLGEKPLNIDSSCSECAIGSRKKIRIECGGNLGLEELEQ